MIDEQWTFLKDVGKLIIKAEELGIILTGGELYRTFEQQEIYVRMGRSNTLNSQHLKRLAIDFNFFKDVDGDGIKDLTYDIEIVRPLGEYWESLSPYNRWGGKFHNWKDVPHFERSDNVRIDITV
jgi:hypothetical protein